MFDWGHSLPNHQDLIIHHPWNGWFCARCDDIGWISILNHVWDWIIPTRFDLDKEFSHAFRAAVYFEPPGGFFAHFDCISWVLSWNAQFCSQLLTSNIVFQVQKNFFKLTGLICFRKKSCFSTVPKILYFIIWNFNHKLPLGLCTLKDYL